MLGKVVGREWSKNKDGDQDVLLLNVEISDPDDVQTVELITQAGEDYNPPDDSTVVINEVGRAYKVAVACDDGLEPDDTLAQGERKIYSSDGGSEVAYIKLLSDGTIEVVGLADNACRFLPLDAVLSVIESTVNNFITQYLAHTHIVSGAATLIPGPAGIPVTTLNYAADQAKIKVGRVKIHGDGE